MRMLSVAGMGQPDDRVPHRMAFALVDAAVRHRRLGRRRFVAWPTASSVEDHFDALQAGERPRQVPVELDGVGIQDQEHPANRPPRTRRRTLGKRRQQQRPMVIADAVGVAGIVERRPLTQEPWLAFFLTPRAPRLHRTDTGAQVMPAADVNHGAPLRPGSRCISPKREEVRQRDPRALSVDDVYVHPIASPHVRPNAVPCKLFRAWNAPCSFCVSTSVLFELAREVR